MISSKDRDHLQLALRLARRGLGSTSPNPMVGAVLVQRGVVIGKGWHRRAGQPHAEIEAIRDAARGGRSAHGATLYVTLEPCCTHGRTPPCTGAIIDAGIRRVVIGVKDPNPNHAGRAFQILRRNGIKVDVLDSRDSLAVSCGRLNEAFNHWIVDRTPFVIVKAAMTLDGKIATAGGESKWITSPAARDHGMKLRHDVDAVLVGVNTILADDPALTFRAVRTERNIQHSTFNTQRRTARRIVLDSLARTPLKSKVVSDAFGAWTTIVVSRRAPKNRVAALAKRVNVLVTPISNSKLKTQNSKLSLPWLLKRLGAENVVSLLVEGGGEVNASFLLSGLAHRIAFFYAPKILGGRDARKAVAGDGVLRLADAITLREIEWRKIGSDLLLTARLHAAERRSVSTFNLSSRVQA